MKEAFTNLARAKLRTFLAVLGIFIGTASIVALMSSGLLATQHALAQFRVLGTNLLGIYLAPSEIQMVTATAKKLTTDDLTSITQQIPAVTQFAPYTLPSSDVLFSGRYVPSQLIGTTENFAAIFNLPLAQGRFISFLDQQTPYCVIGSDVANTLQAYGVQPVLGQQIQIGHTFFTIIGVLKPVPINLFLTTALNEAIILNLPASLLLSKELQINNILFQLQQNASLELVKQQLADFFQKAVPQYKVQFKSPEELVDVMDKQQTTFTWLLYAISAIALIVGGIGVMNVMLISVMERRHEVGIRMAVGAEPKNILKMFLTEAVLLTLLGGLTGVIAGIGISAFVAWSAGWLFAIFFLPIGVGFFISVIIGIVAGLYPAYRAAKLPPIVALGL